ncbi:unnamed protein product [Orchesella dallaii]|uniref:Prefoldin subunit 3 n=1 Tax=Orchesella dallaii TaxID=48710 RepID=A0ABP1RXL0_9HEXA
MEGMIVNEVLSATQHAILTGRTNDEIVPYFQTFYDDEAIIEAKKSLDSLLGKRFSARRTADAKKKYIVDIVDTLRHDDVRGQLTSRNIAFVALDLGNVCYVQPGIGDETILRREVAMLKGKFQDLTAAYDEVKTFIGVVENLTKELQTLKTKPSAIQKPSFLEIAKQSNEPRQGIDAFRTHTPTPASPPLSQQIAMQIANNQMTIADSGGTPVAASASAEQDENKSPSENEFILVKRRKHSSSKMRVIVGGSNESNIKSVKNHGWDFSSFPDVSQRHPLMI